MKCPNDSAPLVMSERVGVADDRDRRDEGHSGYRGKKKEHWLGELFG